MYTCTMIIMRCEKEGRSKQGQTNNKAKQHSTPKAVNFPKKNDLPQVHVNVVYVDTQWALHVTTL